MNPILSVHTWVSLPTEVRYRIRALFDIPKSAGTIVNDGVIETDGTTKEDFKHLTIEKMQKFLQSDSTDFYKLFDLMVAKVNDDIEQKRLTQFPIINANPQTDVKSTKKSKKE